MRQHPEGRRGGRKARRTPALAVLLVVMVSAGLVGAFPSVASATVPIPTFSVTTPGPIVASPVGFDGSASYDPKAPDHITLFVWSFGDGSHTVTGATPTHTFTAAGSYSVTLTVTDDENISASAIRVVTVAPLSTPTPPVLYRVSPPLSASPGKAYGYTFAATGFPDPTYSLTGAPNWLTMASDTGAVSGTPPSGTTSFSYWVVATDGVGSPATAGPFKVSVKVVSGGNGGGGGGVGAEGAEKSPPISLTFPWIVHLIRLLFGFHQIALEIRQADFVELAQFAFDLTALGLVKRRVFADRKAFVGVLDAVAFAHEGINERFARIAREVVSHVCADTSEYDQRVRRKSARPWRCCWQCPCRDDE